MKKLYSPKDLELMRIAEQARLPGQNRVEEIKKFARLAGYKKIGVAYCLAFKKEAEKLKVMLDKEFEVYMTDCKTGKIPSAELLGNDAKGISCNPAEQARYLEENGTEMNIAFGLCMGHDLVFHLKSKIPVTSLVVKDRKHQHNPIKIFKD